MAEDQLRHPHDLARSLFLFTVSYPANDFYGAKDASDIGIGLFLVYAGIALVTASVVFALVLPWAFRRGSSGGLALALAIPGTLLAPGFWTGSLPDLPPAVRCSAGPGATRRKAASSRKPPS